MPRKDVIRIGSASGYWGDDPYALRRQVQGELKLDYIILDFLAEVTMSILQKQKSRDRSLGYARDFVNYYAPVMKECQEKGITIVTNAGGVSPHACAEEILQHAKSQGLNLKIAVVDGDDIFNDLDTFIRNGVNFDNMETHEHFRLIQKRVLSANVYFGSLPITKALEANPDLVVCGRVTDSSLTLAPLIKEFSWAHDDFDKLAHGIVAGHILECGAQVSGGNFTDWQKIPSFIDIGFPIVECYPDGDFVLMKHPSSGGFISCQTVREQLLYEMSDAHSYITPDVVADFSSIKIESKAHNEVLFSHIKGCQTTETLKVSIAYADGFKCSGSLIISGPDVREKAEVFSKIFWKRLDSELNKLGLSPIDFKNTEYIGDDSTHKGMLKKQYSNEILLRLSARDFTKEKLYVFRKLLPSMILSGPAGVAVTGAAPQISEIVSYWPCLMPRHLSQANVHYYNYEFKKDSLTKESIPDIHWPKIQKEKEVAKKLHSCQETLCSSLISKMATSPKIKVALMEISHARSGDKGDTVNIGLIGRSRECYVWLRENISDEKVKEWFHSLCKGDVKRFEVPNLWALNFLLEKSLGGGGTKSLQIDAQGKTFSQALLRAEVNIPKSLLQTIKDEDRSCAGELSGGGGYYD